MIFEAERPGAPGGNLSRTPNQQPNLSPRRPGTISPSTRSPRAPVVRGRWLGSPSSALRPSSANAIASAAPAGTPCSVERLDRGARHRRAQRAHERGVARPAAADEQARDARAGEVLAARVADRLGAEREQRRDEIVERAIAPARDERLRLGESIALASGRLGRRRAQELVVEQLREQRRDRRCRAARGARPRPSAPRRASRTARRRRSARWRDRRRTRSRRRGARPEAAR